MPILLLSHRLRAIGRRVVAGRRRLGPDDRQGHRLLEIVAERGRLVGHRRGTGGVTGIVVTGMLQTGKVTPGRPGGCQGSKFIESLINPKAGHIAVDAVVQLHAA